jgi:hypothetical protein
MNKNVFFENCRMVKQKLIYIMEDNQIARWQHLSRLKASAFLFENFLLGVKKNSNLYLSLVTPSSG